ncbi:MAG TPA: hypothetical protein ENO14_03020 [Chromatiales bacterium]|nr:hypothetical protein [Chromatiales bacterium]
MARGTQQAAGLAREAGERLAGDLVRFGVMCLVASAIMLGFYTRRLAPVVAGVLVMVVGCVDFYLVDRNILHPERFRGYESLRIIHPRSTMDKYDDPDPVTTFLEKEQRHYRIFPVQSPRQPFSGLFNSNRFMAREIASIGGYNPAKLKVYDDFLRTALPAALSRGDYRLVDMLNVRYIVSGAPYPDHPRFRAAWQGTNAAGEQRFVYENMPALPRVYFVDRYRVASGDDALQLLGSGAVDVGEEVVLAESPGLEPSSDEGATAEVSEWEFSRVRISASLPQAAILVVSEVYYPGWKATVDGEPAHVLQANHVLRALALPAGEHDIVMSYDTSLLKRGLTLSVSAFSISLLMLIGSIVVTRTRSRRNLGRSDLHTDVQ